MKGAHRLQKRAGARQRNCPVPLTMNELLNALQWPAMAVTVVASYLVASQSKRRRTWGFWLFLAGNALWLGWGWYAGAAALMVLQVVLAILNIRGARKNDPDAAKPA